MNNYIQFDNGKKYSPKDIAEMVSRLRKTSSKEELIKTLIKEYKFTYDDTVRFRILLKSLLDYWDELEFMDKYQK